MRDFWESHSGTEQALKSWYKEIREAKWAGMHELKRAFPSASILADNRVVFNIKGNRYRLIVKVNFDFHLCWIRFIGTHAEYNKINANEV